MALLAISLTSAWLVTEVKSGNAQGLIFTDNGTPTDPPQNDGAGNRAPADPGDEDGGDEGDVPLPGGEANPPSNGDQSGDNKSGDNKSGDNKPGDVARSKYGPVGPLDRDFLAKIQLSALWQRPTGEEAKKKATSALVKDAGARIAIEQAALDSKARAIAGELKLELPDEPNAQQQEWVSELSAKRGKEYDQLFVDRLRAAQGNLFPLVGQTRATTRNSLIRAFAQTASTVTLQNMTYLERTGLVGPRSLPSPPAVSPEEPVTPGNGGASSPSAPNKGGNTGPKPETGTNPGNEKKPGNNSGSNSGNKPNTGNGPAEGDTTEGGDAESDDLEEGDALDEGEDAANPGNGSNSNPRLPTRPPNNSNNPQGNPADNQAGGVATTPTSSLSTGTNGMGKYLIIIMLAVAGIICMVALRGLYRPR